MIRAASAVLVTSAGLAVFVFLNGGGLRAAEEEENVATKPVVRIASPAGGWTSERKVKLEGTVEGDGVDRVQVNANGTTFTLPVESGRFERDVVLAPGENGFRVTARSEAGRGSDSVLVHARVEPKDVRVTLVWDTAETDMDLWVADPDGEVCKYDHAATKLGGSLDVDITSGYGPEVFTLARAKAGSYVVKVHKYGGGPPTRIRVEVVLHEGTEREERREAGALLVRKDDVIQALTFTVTGASR